MKLSDLINNYQANGYVLQTKGSGSTDPMWIDYQAAIEIDASIAEIEMHHPYGDELTHADLADYRLAIDDEDALVANVSDWLDLGNDSDYRFRFLF